jgi:hypothetical protein
MGSTASSKTAAETPVKVKKDSVTKKPVRKTAPKKTKSRVAPVKKKAAAAPKKAPASKKATSKQKAPRKKAASKARARPVHAPDNGSDVAPVTGTTASRPGGKTATDTVQADSRSLSWMAAQAASALKAVKANQSERAQALLAKAEITPATPVRPRKDISALFAAGVPETQADVSANKMPEPVKQEANRPLEPAVSETIKESRKETSADTTPVPGKTRTSLPMKTPPAVAATEEELSAPSAAVLAEPAEQETVEVPVARVAIVTPEAVEDVREKQLDTPPPHVIAHTPATTGSKRRIGPILLTGTVILIGVLGVRVWFSGNDTADIAAVQDSAGTEQASPVTVEPQKAVISVVTSEPEGQPATAATHTTDGAPSAHHDWPPAPDQSREDPESQPEVAAAAPETMPREPVVSEPRQVQATTQNTRPVPQAASPTVPQAGYYAPAYGYYPQQPVRQQPYYQPMYAQPAYRQ